MLITSSQNAKFRWLKSLKLKKYRQREAAVIVEGRRAIEQVIALGYDIKYLVLNETVEWQLSADYQTIYLTEGLFNQLSDTVHSQGVLAVVSLAIQVQPIDYSAPIVVLNAVQDPGNMGTILRTCEAFGFKQIIATKGCVDVYSAKVLRASLAAVFGLTIVQNQPSAELIACLKDNTVPILATALQAAVPLKQVHCTRNYALVFGNEGSGVEDIWLDNATQCITINTSGAMQSLNVAASAAIVLYEFAK